MSRITVKSAFFALVVLSGIEVAEAFQTIEKGARTVKVQRVIPNLNLSITESYF